MTNKVSFCAASRFLFSTAALTGLFLAPLANAQVPTMPPTWQTAVGTVYGGLANCPVPLVYEILSGGSCESVGAEAMSRYEENRASCIPSATVVGGCTSNYPWVPTGRDCPASAVSATWYWYTSTIWVNPNTGDGCNGTTMSAVCPDGSLALQDPNLGIYCPRSTFEDQKNLGGGVPSKRPMHGSGERGESFFHATHVDSGCYSWCMLE